MPVWAQLVAVSLGVSAIIAGGSGLWRLGKALWLLARRVMQFFDDWQGEPEVKGVRSERPGVLARLTAIERGIAAIPDIEQRLSAVERRTVAIETELTNGEQQRPKIEAGGVGFQAEIAAGGGRGHEDSHRRRGVDGSTR